jgi:hypothetical protein
MTREQVVISQIRIAKAGQVKHFQVKLPKTAKRIIGIELGAKGNFLKREVPFAEVDSGKEVPIRDGVIREGIGSSVIFRRNVLVGELKLQSCEEANLFYSGYIQTDENIGIADYSQRFFVPNVFTHQTHSFEEIVIVDAESTILQGIYRDRIGEQSKTDYNYLVSVYVWIEIEVPQTQTK